MSPQVPDIFKNYKNKDIKMPGQNGIIQIELQTDERAKTFIKSLRSSAPFLIQKAIYPEQDSHFAHVYMMSSSGGILQGDELKIDITMGKGSSARVTTQSATKIYKMDQGYATQYITIQSKEGSYLEFVPHQIIPFKSSRFYQEVNLKVEANAFLIYSEIISAGRTASGEKFDFDLCFLRTTAYRGGKILFTDVMSLSNKYKKHLESLFARKEILSTLYIISDSKQIERIEEEVNSAIKNSSLLASCSALPHDSGIIVRILGNSVSEIMALTEKVVGIFRVIAKKEIDIKPAIESRL